MPTLKNCMDVKREFVLMALNNAKEIIEIQYKYLPPLAPPPPIGCINEAIKLMAENKFLLERGGE